MSFAYLFFKMFACLNTMRLVSKACFQAGIQLVQTISRDVSWGIKGACKPASGTSLFFNPGN